MNVFFFCPGTVREALLWREPCNSVVGRHRSHSVWTADASWFSTSDTPTGSRQEGQVMHVGVVPSAQPQAALKLLTAKSSSVRFSACRIDWCILFKSSSYKTNNNCLFMDFQLNSDSLRKWGVPWDLHKIKKPSYYYFFVPVWKLIF